MLRSVMLYYGVLGAVTAFDGTGPASQCIASPGTLPLAARVASCKSPPCALPQRESAIIDIAFRAPRSSTTLTTEVTAFLTISKVEISIPLDLAEKSTTCSYLLNSSCPVREGEILLYTLTLPIEPPFPAGLTAMTEITILDDTGAVVCIRVPFKIKPSRVLNSSFDN